MHDKGIILAHLKLNVEPNVNKILEEISSILEHSLETGTETSFLTSYPNLDITKFNKDTGEIIKGSIPGYKVISLTTSEDALSKYGFNSFRDTMPDKAWNWIANLPETKKAVESLPFDEYYIVKVISLDPGGIGIPHTDSKSPTGTSLTIELLDGGVKLNIFYNGKCYSPSSNIFYFDDSVLHGVEQITTKRIVMRIHGKLNDTWQDFIDHSQLNVYR